MTIFVAVEAKPRSKVVLDPSDHPEGYFQQLGVTARDEEELLRIITDYLDADLGSNLMEISERWQTDFEGSDRDVRDEVGDLDEIGIWYRSGRAWFRTDGDEEDEEAETVN